METILTIERIILSIASAPFLASTPATTSLAPVLSSHTTSGLAVPKTMAHRHRSSLKSMLQPRNHRTYPLSTFALGTRRTTLESAPRLTNPRLLIYSHHFRSQLHGIRTTTGAFTMTRRFPSIPASMIRTSTLSLGKTT